MRCQLARLHHAGRSSSGACCSRAPQGDEKADLLHREGTSRRVAPIILKRTVDAGGVGDLIRNASGDRCQHGARDDLPAEGPASSSN